MLDVARHFFTIDEVKRYIDYLAFYKMNVLHLHLSDDQGWRIEMKKWPRLTTFGAQREVGGTTGGFYTQEQYLELVQYAADRFVLVVPEIDLPGHTHAAMASYPELSCDGRSRELYTGIDVGFSSLCYQKESTFAFIADVVDELFDSEVVVCGKTGDSCLLVSVPIVFFGASLLLRFLFSLSSISIEI